MVLFHPLPRVGLFAEIKKIPLGLWLRGIFFMVLANRVREGGGISSH
jgi:hypothetical protein